MELQSLLVVRQGLLVLVHPRITIGDVVLGNRIVRVRLDDDLKLTNGFLITRESHEAPSEIEMEIGILRSQPYRRLKIRNCFSRFAGDVQPFTQVFIGPHIPEVTLDGATEFLNGFFISAKFTEGQSPVIEYE